MRRLGYRTIDALVERLSRPWDATPIVRTATPEELAARLGGPAPEEPVDGAVLLERLERDVLPFMARNEHPGYFAYIPGCATWPGALGDLIASALNMDVGSWGLSAGPSAVELAVLDWFKEWIGNPRDAAGILTSGGSAANMTALACAREAVVGAMSDRLVVYCADQAHSSIARAARILGFRPDQVRVLPVDARSRLRPDALVAAMEADVRAGREPLFVAAAAGSTSTGAVDPLQELGEICRERGVWLHGDAAYGGFAAIAERGRSASCASVGGSPGSRTRTRSSGATRGSSARSRRRRPGSCRAHGSAAASRSASASSTTPRGARTSTRSSISSSARRSR